MRRPLLAALPALILGSVLLAAWPGYLSFDAAFQWYQARSGQYADIAPPLLPALWSLLLMLGLPATTGPLLLSGGLHAFGFARLALLADTRGNRTLAWLLAVAGPLCPLLILLLPHVWTDLLLSGAMLAAVALLAGGPRRRFGHCAVFLLLASACGVRHNGLFAVLPVLLWWTRSMVPLPTFRHYSATVVTLLLAMLLGNHVLRDQLVRQPLDTWAVTPLFDLQAVSVATDLQLLPASVVGPGMDVAQLRAAFHPYSSTRLFDSTTSGVSNPTVAPLQPAQRADLLAAWRSLPAEPAWWSHRWRLLRGLLGSHRSDDLRGLADSPALLGYADNPPLQVRFPAAHAAYRVAVEWLRSSWLYAPGFYLLAGSLAAAGAWMWRRRRPVGPAASIATPGLWLALLGSAWVYTLPYVVLAPSAETRYLLWPALAGWLAVLLVLGSRAGRRADRVEGAV